MEQAKQEADAARREYEKHQQGRGRLDEEAQDAENDLRRVIASLQQKNGELEQAETRLQNLRREGGPDETRVNKALLRAIEQENSFSKRPVGPIGQHISLLQPKWSSVLENSLGATLDSFVVTSKRDMNILSNIMQRVNW